MLFAISLLAALSVSEFVFVSATPVTPGFICKGNQAVTATQFVGREKKVKMDFIACDNVDDSGSTIFLQTRQAASVCGASCTTHCFNPSGGGPDPNDCHIIADALRFDSQNIAPVFQIGNGTNNIISMTFSSCTSFFLNQASTPLNYCRTDFAAVIDFVALNCQATQNAHGGLCLAADGTWFVQVQH